MNTYEYEITTKLQAQEKGGTIKKQKKLKQ